MSDGMKSLFSFIWAVIVVALFLFAIPPLVWALRHWARYWEWIIP
jgi:hypothetical protein